MSNRDARSDAPAAIASDRVKVLTFGSAPRSHKDMRFFFPSGIAPVLALVCSIALVQHTTAQTISFYTDCLCPVKIVSSYASGCLLGPSSLGASVSVDDVNSPGSITPPPGKVIVELDFYFPTTASTPIYSWYCSPLGMFNQTSAPIYCGENGFSVRVNTQGTPPTFRLTCF